MRAPVIGGSELETLSIIRALPELQHRVIFPSRFEHMQPSIRDQFDVPVEAVDDVGAFLQRMRAGILHVQFPFLLVDDIVGHDSVLELERLPDVPTVFTVHAAVNVPIVPQVHYVFHTERLANRFADQITSDRRTVCPSLVTPPSTVPHRDSHKAVRILWVSRNEEGKFHPEVPAIVAAVLEANPNVHFRFIGQCEHAPVPKHERVSVEPCPAQNLAKEYAAADIFWHFPHPLLEETWCRTVTEAMAHALPCVVAAHGAMSSQVQNGVHGSVVAKPAHCIDALIKLSQASATERTQLGTNSRQTATRFEAECLSTWRALYRRLSTRSPA